MLLILLSRRQLVVKNPPAQAGDGRDMSLIPGFGRFPGEGHGNPLQYSCLENSMDRGAWQTIVHRIAKSWNWNGLACSLHWYYCLPKHKDHFSISKVVPFPVLPGLMLWLIVASGIKAKVLLAVHWVPGGLALPPPRISSSWAPHCARPLSFPMATSDCLSSSGEGTAWFLLLGSTRGRIATPHPVPGQWSHPHQL